MVPDNGVVDTFVVSIDLGGSFDVVLDILARIDSLSVGSDDTLSFDNSRDLTIVAGDLTNENLISLDSTGSLTDLNLQNGAAITGSGTIQLSDTTTNRLLTNGTTITHGADHTIQGAGQLLANTGGMINNGTILATGSSALAINPDVQGFVNQGTMQATGAGGLQFFNGTYTNTGQTIEIGDGSRLELRNLVTVDGGTLQTVGSGIVELTQTGATEGVASAENEAIPPGRATPIATAAHRGPSFLLETLFTRTGRSTVCRSACSSST